MGVLRQVFSVNPKMLLKMMLLTEMMMLLLNVLIRVGMVGFRVMVEWVG